MFVLLFILAFLIAGCGESGKELVGMSSTTTTQSGNLEDIVKAYANKNDLQVNLVRAVIEAESAWDSKALSSVGAMGLMQLMPGTAKTLGVQDAFDPEQNIAGGTKYLKMMLDKFDGDVELALAAYNAGPGAVEKYKGIPPYDETINYVDNVMLIYESYEENTAK